jgi:glycosyltransferase 2 family protein
VPVLLFFVSSDSLFPFQSDFASNNGYTLLWVAYSIIVLINLILGIGIFVRPQLFGKMALWIYRLPFLKKRKAKAEKFSEDILIASVELKGKTFGFWFRVFAVTCWSWLSRYLVINFLLLAFLDLTFFDHLVVLARQLVMWLGMIIPSTPGGTGVAEYLFGFFLADFIPNGPLALSLAFIWRLISYYPYLLIGSIVLPRWLGRKKSETSV